MLKMPDGNRCPALHVPPDMVPDPNPYKGREVFCVSRNPYSRAVSEYLWARERFDRRLSGKKEICPGCRHFSMCSVAGMNFFLKKVMGRVQEGKLYVNRCHMLPQTRFMVADDGSKLCHHIRAGEERANEMKSKCPLLSQADLTHENRK